MPKEPPLINITPAAVVPNLQVAPAADRFWFWLGSLPGCPTSSYDLAGISFPAKTEHVQPARSSRDSRRILLAGHLCLLTRAQLELLAARLPTRVFRFLPRVLEPGRGAQVLDRPASGPVGIQIVIPTQEELALAASRGRRLKPYAASRFDRPVADFLYLQYQPGRSPAHKPIGSELPPPLSKTGIQLPSDAIPVPEGSLPQAISAPSTDGGWRFEPPPADIPKVPE